MWLFAAVALAAAPLAADEKKYEIDFQSDVVYGTAAGDELKLDLATPKGVDSPPPGLVFIHGGGWQGGKKEDLAAAAKAAAAAGYVAVSVNYRLAPKHPFPAQVEDCKCAVRWMRAKADELKVDPKQIGALGVSAGAHLAMMLGVMDPADGLEGDGGWSDQSSKVQAAVSYVGPTNLIGDFPPISLQILNTFLGGSMDEKHDLYEQASPVKYVNAGDPPMLLFAGTKDDLVPYDQVFQMTTALTGAGVPGRIEMLIGAGHGFSLKEYQRTMAEAMQFFDDCLRPAESETGK
ncbi:MAG TPA: alpha/beta hydrolase [Pirellulales bacterium]|nr:alpha/beta hydrolase [Pirellulales bacterium]